MVSDMEGNVSYECETDYWSEEASDLWSSVTIDGQLSNHLGNNYQNEFGYFDTQHPPITIRANKFNFDNYEKRYSKKIRMYFTDKDFSSLNKKDYKGCISKVGELVTIKTFYGSAYGIIESGEL